MSLSPLPAFTPDAAINFWFGATTSNVALPGTPASDTTVILTNQGQVPIFFKLGTTNAVTVTVATGFVVMPGQWRAIGIGSNTYLAGITVGGQTGTGATANIVTGN